MAYDWLKQETAPKLLKQAVSHLGVKEFVGSAHNPIILGWAKSLKLSTIYTNDEIPWCGLFIAYCCHAEGLQVVERPLWALNWAKYGNKVDDPMLGDILTFKRDGGGHVGIYVGEDDKYYHVLGGNQSNSVSVTRIAKTRLHQARRTAWKVAQPSNVRKVYLEARGQITTNEK
jgi:uncharacterized protein (TIGR02594 family)